MAIKSSPVGSVKLTGDDAEAFLRQIGEKFAVVDRQPTEGKRVVKINEFEHAILKQSANLDDEGRGPTEWGAAVGAAGEFLRWAGYMRRDGSLTEAGLAKAREPYEPSAR